jgi:hypothetical protein
LRRDLPAAQFGGDDRDLVRPHLDMAQQQRQDALADAAEADDHEAAGKCDMLVVGHCEESEKDGCKRAPYVNYRPSLRAKRRNLVQSGSCIARAVWCSAARDCSIAAPLELTGQPDGHLFATPACNSRPLG